MDDWQEKIGEIVRETYAQQGYTDILIMIGAIAPDKDIHTQIWTAEDTAGDFDLRLMVFMMLNHLFSEYNETLTDVKENPWKYGDDEEV